MAMSQKSLLLVVALFSVSAKLHDVGTTHGHVFVPPNASAFRYIGRFDRSLTEDGRRVMNFDMNGCEIQFMVEGARQVFLHMEQQISGPHGWYSNHSHKNTALAKRLRMTSSMSNGHGHSSHHNQDNHDHGMSLLQSSADSTATAASEELAAIRASMEPSGSQPQEFLVYIDGVPQSTPVDGSPCRGCTFDTRLARNGKVHRYLVARDLSAGPHEIRIFKTSDPEWSSRQPTPNWLGFHGIDVDAGELKAPAAPRPKRRIEFFGDSITSGYCNLCRSGDDVVERQGSFAAAWPQTICQALGAECHTLALAGFGIARNCCGDNEIRMADLWSRGVATDSDSQWDFASWVPDALVIHLGANDHLWDPAVDTDKFRKEYVDLVVATGNTYGPDLKVFLGCGPTEASTKACPHVEAVVEKVKEYGIDAHFLDQRGYFSSGHHCCFHPSAAQSNSMARDTGALISQALGWE